MNIEHILQQLIYILQGLSTLVIVWGIIIQFIAFVKSELTSSNRLITVESLGQIKNFLGIYILFGLEILIGADIIESILDPSLGHIFILAVIVIIRTIISHFLSKEIEATNK